MTIQTINRGAVNIEFPLYAIIIYNGGETQTSMSLKTLWKGCKDWRA